MFLFYFSLFVSEENNFPFLVVFFLSFHVFTFQYSPYTILICRNSYWLLHWRQTLSCPHRCCQQSGSNRDRHPSWRPKVSYSADDKFIRPLHLRDMFIPDSVQQNIVKFIFPDIETSFQQCTYHMFSSVNELTVSSILIYHFWLNQSGSNVYFVGAVQYLVMVPGG